MSERKQYTIYWKHSRSGNPGSTRTIAQSAQEARTRHRALYPWHVIRNVIERK